MDINGNPMMDAALLEREHRNWGWYFVLGVGLVILGIIAIVSPFIASLAVVITMGWFLVIGGVIQAIYAFWGRRTNGFFWALASGVLYFIVGLMILASPTAGLLTLTLLLGVLFGTSGIVKLVAGMTSRSLPSRGWVIFSGAVSLVLAIIILAELPSAALWVLGTLVGVDLIILGWSAMMSALFARNVQTLPAYVV